MTSLATIMTSIVWDVAPEIIKNPIEIRWYGLLYAMTFLVGLFLLQRMFKYERVKPEWADTVLLYMLVGTVVGARLGHCLFYEPDVYLSDPIRILKIWEGGLASHGGAIGILLALWLYSRNISKRPMLWIVDRVVPQVALGGLFIRTGNLMNSEIFGKQTDLPWGFEFIRAPEFFVNGHVVPRHPTQLYEGLVYFLIFGLLMYLYWKTDAKNKRGLLLGVFLVLVFTARLLIEFLKEPQTGGIGDQSLDEQIVSMIGLNLGQLLSLPFIIAGIYLIFMKKKPYPDYKPYTPEENEEKTTKKGKEKKQTNKKKSVKNPSAHKKKL